MNTQENVGETSKGRDCTDKQEHFVKSMQEVIKIALDNNDIRHQLAAHDQRLTAHDSRITVVEVSITDNSADIKNILKHVENSLSVDDQKKILSYLETYETTKQKAIKWWLVSSSVLLLAVLAGFPLKDIIAGIGKNLLKMIL